MKNSWEDIFAIMESRRSAQSPIIQQMIEVRDRYNGDWVLPDVSDEVRSTVPNLSPQIIADTVDNYGMRAASVMPMLRSPALKPSKQRGVKSREYAGIRGQILQATYRKNRMQLQLRKAYRHVAAYAMASMIVMPDLKAGFPRISLRDPLCTFPDPIANEDFRSPENIGYIFAKSASWILDNYPETAGILSEHPSANEIMWNMVEWVDCDDIVVGLMGPQEYPAPYQMSYGARDWQAIDWTKELRRWPNTLKRVPAICPGRVSLDRIASQLANITGMTDLMAKLTALDIAAKEKSIFPDKYIIGKNGTVPRLVGGEWKDGRTGEINIIVDADGIGSLNFASDPTATQAIDRLERNARVSAGLVPQMGGETYGALRTGRGIDALMGAAVDPKLQEMQVVMETWLEYLNEAILDCYVEHWPTKTFVMPFGRGNHEVEFTPNVHIETNANSVSYAIAGADVQGTTIVLGQMLGMKMISKTTAMDRHPFVDDVELEKAKIDEEMIEEMAFNSIAQAIASGQVPPIFTAFLERARREGDGSDIIEAIEAANRAMQEMQAQQAPPPQEGQVAAPETQPGMTGPAQQAPPPGGGAGDISTPPNLGNLRELVNALGQTSGVVQR